jgi:hypothetical protein
MNPNVLITLAGTSYKGATLAGCDLPKRPGWVAGVTDLNFNSTVKGPTDLPIS